MFPADDVRVGRSQLGDDAGVRGAAALAVQVIFENSYLKDEHKIRLCEICGELSVDWVKTSTGYGSGGATMEDLTLMRKHLLCGSICPHGFK
jgi:deoxyribose-phosphate aldolase